MTTITNPPDFKGAMRRLTTTVSVISCAHGDTWAGMTATAITSVCAEPPALLVCINGAAAMHSSLLASQRYCVNMLRVGQESVSRAFSGKLRGMQRFSEGSWALSDDGLPYLKT